MSDSVNDFVLFAHRGDNRNYTENTLDAFRSSMKAGYRAIELDLVRLRDGNIVVFHDDDLERICGIKKTISEVVLDEFRNLFPALLTFDDLVKNFSESAIEINLEIKDDAKTLEMIAESAGRLRHPVISSFHPDIVDLAIERGFEGAYLFDNFFSFFKRKYFLKSRRVHIAARMILQSPLAGCIFSDYDVYCYTVNDVETALRLKKKSFVRGIFTDRVEMISELVA